MAEKTTQNKLDEDSHSFLITGITWQESLLQSYRNYLLITQSIFIAVEVGLLSLRASGGRVFEELMILIPFMVIFVLGISSLFHLNGAIKERAKAVDWWQRRLLIAENRSGRHGHFSAFRIAKEHYFKPPEIEAHQLNEAEIQRLLRAETPKARKVFNLFVPGLGLIWAILLVSAGVGLWETMTVIG